MADFQVLILSIEDNVGIIQMNDTRKRNALGWELHEEIIRALQLWAFDDRVAAVMLIGNEDYFCSGWALDTLQNTDSKGDERTRFVDLAYNLMISLYDFRKPTIAAVAGTAPGYGMDLANMCDITVASLNSRFGSTQVKYAMNGFYHGMLRKVGAQVARRMLFTGDPISAEEAYRVGMVDKLAPVGKLRETALALAKDVAEAGPELTTVLKEVALRGNNMDHVGATAYELRVTADLVQRGLFTKMIDQGVKRMKAKRSRAIEKL
ncbi:hypothetical protein RBB50_008109 [Rhinocladiella similis]